MKPFSNSGIPQFDPSQMDPKLMMELSRVIQQLPPAQLQKMQALMHNMMAGFDVRKEMEEFESSLPPGFREKLMTLMGGQEAASAFSAQKPDVIEVEASSSTQSTSAADMNLREARLTILRAVADGRIVPEEAERLLFSA